MSQVGASSTNPIFQTIFQILVPILLGGILTYLANIAQSQHEQGKSIYLMQGQLSGITQQNTDYNNRLGKMEVSLDGLSKNVNTDGTRITVLESRRHF